MEPLVDLITTHVIYTSPLMQPSILNFSDPLLFPAKTNSTYALVVAAHTFPHPLISSQTPFLQPYPTKNI
jgi:hypothetical protein